MSFAESASRENWKNELGHLSFWIDFLVISEEVRFAEEWIIFYVKLMLYSMGMKSFVKLISLKFIWDNNWNVCIFSVKTAYLCKCNQFHVKKMFLLLLNRKWNKDKKMQSWFHKKKLKDHRRVILKSNSRKKVHFCLYCTLYWFHNFIFHWGKKGRK